MITVPESTAFPPLLLRTADYFAEQFDDPDADDPSEQWTAAHTLSQFFFGYFEPVCLSNADAKTVQCYREAIAHWIKIHTRPAYCDPDFMGPRPEPEAIPTLPEPRVKDLTPKSLVNFTSRLKQERGKKAGSKMAKATVAKHVRHLQPVLDCLGPETKSNRAGAGALSKVPYFPRLKIPKQPPRAEFSLQELGDLLAACSVAKQPKVAGLRASAWWQALLILIYNTGLRIGSCLDLRYEWIRLDGSKGGWAAIAPEAIKHDQGRDVPLNSYVLESLSTIRTARELVFPWNCRRRYVDEVFQQIKKAAGIAPQDGRMFHAIRRLCSSELAKQGPAVAQFVLGHAGLSTTKAHYINDKSALHFTEQLTQPPPPEPPDPQRRLFE